MARTRNTEQIETALRQRLRELSTEQKDAFILGQINRLWLDIDRRGEFYSSDKTLDVADFYHSVLDGLDALGLVPSLPLERDNTTI